MKVTQQKVIKRLKPLPISHVLELSKFLLFFYRQSKGMVCIEKTTLDPCRRQI